MVIVILLDLSILDTYGLPTGGNSGKVYTPAPHTLSFLSSILLMYLYHNFGLNCDFC